MKISVKNAETQFKSKLLLEKYLSIKKSEDISIRYSCSDNFDEAEKIVFVLNGRSEWIEKFAHFIDALSLPEKTAWVTWDHRGQGKSGGKRSHIDHYDSFTYNVAQYFSILREKVKVYRNDQITVEKIRKLSPDQIVLSPGPGDPDSAGICLDVIKELSGEIPILGICLGHQSIAQAFGGRVVKARRMMHGKTSQILHKKTGLYKGLESPITVTRYHSLVVERETLPKCFRITSETSDGVIMGIKHRRFPVEGIQFHPESYMTDSGLQMLENFVR